MNLHCLELFYFVVRHGGVSGAARKMPYGIQPSSISKQLIQFEEQLGACLFQRRPFELTPAGEKLYAFIEPFFEAMPGVTDQLRKGVPEQVRLAASPIVLRDYLPPILRKLRQAFPELRFTLREGLQWQVEKWFEERMIDLAVTMLEGAPPADCLSEILLRLPMILLVPSGSRLRSASELWRRRRIDEMLICPNPIDAISRCFHLGLRNQAVQWPIGIEVNSIELVEACVTHGLGIGVSVRVPGWELAPGLRALSLPRFPPVQVAMVWRRRTNVAAQALMNELRLEAKRLIGAHGKVG